MDFELFIELFLVEKFLDCRLRILFLFVDNSMEVFYFFLFIVVSVVNEIYLVFSLLEGIFEYMYLDFMEVCSNEILLVFFYKVWKDDCLLMVWLVFNKSGSELKSVNLEIVFVENFKVR